MGFWRCKFTFTEKFTQWICVFDVMCAWALQHLMLEAGEKRAEYPSPFSFCCWLCVKKRIYKFCNDEMSLWCFFVYSQFYLCFRWKTICCCFFFSFRFFFVADVELLHPKTKSNLFTEKNHQKLNTVLNTGALCYQMLMIAKKTQQQEHGLLFKFIES